MRGNGLEAWLRSIVQPVRSSDGRIKHFSIYASDLTRTIEASREHENLIGCTGAFHRCDRVRLGRPCAHRE